MNRNKVFTHTTIAALLLVVGCSTACKKKTVAVSTPPPPAAAQQTQPTPTAPAQRPAPAPRETARTEPTRSRMPDAVTKQKIEDLLARINDVYFDYNQHSLRPDAEAALKADAQTLSDILKQYPDFKLRVEGQCDERGSAEYNLALGNNRAAAAKEYLTTLGLPGDQMVTISLGKERPVCTEHDESCWQKNRRAHLTTAGM
jgi:peptidoglycan-associated lipoprotein